ncbi:MAG: hypothetical protein PUG39_07375, partial [Succiniclasticum sp.]|nr:hypothetical protein [Succiniclasticum sp.]
IIKERHRGTSFHLLLVTQLYAMKAFMSLFLHKKVEAAMAHPNIYYRTLFLFAYYAGTDVWCYNYIVYVFVYAYVQHAAINASSQIFFHGGK